MTICWGWHWALIKKPILFEMIVGCLFICHINLRFWVIKPDAWWKEPEHNANTVALCSLTLTAAPRVFVPFEPLRKRKNEIAQFLLQSKRRVHIKIRLMYIFCLPWSSSAPWFMHILQIWISNTDKENSSRAPMGWIIFLLSHQRTRVFFIYDDSQYASEQYLTSVNCVEATHCLMSNHNWCTKGTLRYHVYVAEQENKSGMMCGLFFFLSFFLSTTKDPTEMSLSAKMTDLLKFVCVCAWRLVKAEGWIDICCLPLTPPLSLTPPSLSSTLLHVLKDSIFMNYLSVFEDIKLVMSLSGVLSPRAS